MRPDRIIVGECRSGEALDMIQAMSTGHKGSLTTHDNSSYDAVSRLTTMVLMSGMDLPEKSIVSQNSVSNKRYSATISLCRRLKKNIFNISNR
jgi:pilus assembly protein CpaF